MTKLLSHTSNKTFVLVVKIFFILLATALGTVVFGLFIPFALIAFNVLPDLGLVGSIYLFIGGVLGFLFVSISTSVSLFKSKKIITRYYIKLMIYMVVISILYMLSYIVFTEAYSHI